MHDELNRLPAEFWELAPIGTKSELTEFSTMRAQKESYWTHVLFDACVGKKWQHKIYCLVCYCQITQNSILSAGQWNFSRFSVHTFRMKGLEFIAMDAGFGFHPGY